jgi:hypothetical protein
LFSLTLALDLLYSPLHQFPFPLPYLLQDITMSPPEISQVIVSTQTAAENDEQYDPSKDPKRKPTKSKDPGWKY